MKRIEKRTIYFRVYVQQVARWLLRVATGLAVFMACFVAFGDASLASGKKIVIQQYSSTYSYDPHVRVGRGATEMMPFLVDTLVSYSAKDGKI